MYLYDAEPNFSLEVLNPRSLICGINCGHKWSISTEKVRTSSIYFFLLFMKKYNIYILKLFDGHVCLQVEPINFNLGFPRI